MMGIALFVTLIAGAYPEIWIGGREGVGSRLLPSRPLPLPVPPLPSP